MSQQQDIVLGHVLVATDLEKTSLEALHVADRWARRSNASLTVVTVVPAGSPITDAQKQELEEQVYEATGRKTGEYAMDFQEGDPAEAVVARAKEVSADLVVVGTHDAKGLERWLISSVAQTILRNAHCPVLVARPSPRDGGVMAACQLDELTPDVVRWAKVPRATPLLLLHTEKLAVSDVALMASAVFSGTVPSTPSRETVDSIAEMTRRSLEAELAKASATGKVEMLEGAPAPTIVARANELGVSLIVVGSHGRRGLARLALGSVAEAVARDAHSSVLVVRST